MAQFAAATNLDTWYARLDTASILEHWRSEVSPAETKRFEEMATKARSKDSTKALAKLARKVDGEFRIISDPPLVVPLGELAGEATEADVESMRTWLNDRFRSPAACNRSATPGGHRLVDFAWRPSGSAVSVPVLDR
jgi:hypothetical protein